MLNTSSSAEQDVRDVDVLISVNCYPGWRPTARTPDGLMKPYLSRPLEELHCAEKPCRVLRCLSVKTQHVISTGINEAIESGENLWR